MKIEPNKNSKIYQIYRKPGFFSQEDQPVRQDVSAARVLFLKSCVWFNSSSESLAGGSQVVLTDIDIGAN